MRLDGVNSLVSVPLAMQHIEGTAHFGTLDTLVSSGQSEACRGMQCAGRHADGGERHEVMHTASGATAQIGTSTIGCGLRPKSGKVAKAASSLGSWILLPRHSMPQLVSRLACMLEASNLHLRQLCCHEEQHVLPAPDLYPVDSFCCWLLSQWSVPAPVSPRQWLLPLLTAELMTSPTAGHLHSCGACQLCIWRGAVLAGRPHQPHVHPVCLCCCRGGSVRPDQGELQHLDCIQHAADLPSCIHADRRLPT